MLWPDHDMPKSYQQRLDERGKLGYTWENKENVHIKQLLASVPTLSTPLPLLRDPSKGGLTMDRQKCNLVSKLT